MSCSRPDGTLSLSARTVRTLKFRACTLISPHAGAAWNGGEIESSVRNAMLRRLGTISATRAAP